MLALMLALLEGFAYVAVQLVDRDDFFDARESVYSRLKDSDLAWFRETRADPVTGWRSIGPRTLKEDNCLGKPIEYHFNAAGARVHGQLGDRASEVVVVGDSYTFGNEVSDNQTYPARLERQLGVPVANHGVGGYGPTQSLLNLQQNITRYPQAKVVVLGIMYENLYRMMNSYRPVLYGSSSHFTLKPYMDDGRIVSHPGDKPLQSLEQFIRTAERSFDHDFWAKPVAEFPYLLAVTKSLGSDHIYYRRIQREFRKLGKPEYFLIFADDEVERNLVALLNEYAEMAEEWGVRPAAIFIPRNRLDTTSASKFIAQNRSKIDSRLLVGDVAEFEGVDWAQFNLQDTDSDNICHPSPYGYGVIAEYTGNLLLQHQLLPAR